MRYEFSGPGSSGWYAAFLPDASAFLASRLFDQNISLWTTAHTPTEGRAPPKAEPVLKGTATLPVSIDIAQDGNLGLALMNGAVVLRRLEGDAPRLAPPDGEGLCKVTFTPSGRHLVALRSGRLFAWSVPERPKAAPATGPR